jgi:hypothetical protein
LNEPTGVRVAPTMTMSSAMTKLLYGAGNRLGRR